MLRILMQRHTLNPICSRARFFSLSPNTETSLKLIQKLLHTDIEWNAFPETVLDNPLCYWGKYSIYINDDPKVREKFILMYNGEEKGRLDSLPKNWKIRTSCADGFLRLGISKQAIKPKFF